MTACLPRLRLLSAAQHSFLTLSAAHRFIDELCFMARPILGKEGQKRRCLDDFHKVLVLLELLPLVTFTITQPIITIVYF